MNVIGHIFHLTDMNAECPALGSDEPFELRFNFSIYQFLSVLCASYQVVADIVHTVR